MNGRGTLATLLLVLTAGYGGAAAAGAPGPEGGTVAPPAVLESAPAGTVYVVFLAPGMRSTLGTSSSETDFVAYHNYFHAAAGLVRYVVVPHQEGFGRWLAAARQGLVQALIDPEGTGWY